MKKRQYESLEKSIDEARAIKAVLDAAVKWKKTYSFEIDAKPGLHYVGEREALETKATDGLFYAVEAYLTSTKRKK